MADKNKIRYGLKEVHYAKITRDEAGTITYGTPVPYKGAVSLTLDAETGDPTKFYADDTIFYQGAGSNSGYTGTLEMASGDSRDDFDCDIMGFKKDAHGNIVENSEAEPEPFALLWQFTGDKSGMKYVAYNCLATRASLSGTTKEDVINPATDSYSLTVSPAEDTHDVQLKCPASSSDYGDFFKKVVVKSAE